MTKLCIKILVKSDSAIESAFPLHCGQYHIRTNALLLCIPTFTHESFISLQERFLDFARNDDTCFLHPKMQCSMNGVLLQTLLTKSKN